VLEDGVVITGLHEDVDLGWEELEPGDGVLGSVDVLQGLTDHHTEDTFL